MDSKVLTPSATSAFSPKPSFMTPKPVKKRITPESLQTYTGPRNITADTQKGFEDYIVPKWDIKADTWEGCSVEFTDEETINWLKNYIKDGKKERAIMTQLRRLTLD